MNVLSLFDGISCGQVALNRAGFKVDNYFSSEIDENAILVTQSNFPNTMQLGDVNKVDATKLPKIDLMFGGSPCQSFSRSGNQGGFDDPRGKLFFEYVRILGEVRLQNPDVYFLLENVRMDKMSEAVITDALGVAPILINSTLVSAQNRERLYWTNIPNVSAPTDKNLKIRDIIDNDGPYEYVHPNFAETAKYLNSYVQYDLTRKGHNSQNFRAYYPDGKMACLNHSTPHGAKILIDGRIRKTTRYEHERLQTLPDGYTSVLSLNKAKEAIGNGWTVDVIAHIFSFIGKENGK